MDGPGRPIDECIALLQALGSTATLDDGFAKDLEEIIAERQPFDTSMWDCSGEEPHVPNEVMG